jgi:hypothetical protein
MPQVSWETFHYTRSTRKNILNAGTERKQDVDLVRRLLVTRMLQSVNMQACCHP